ncbi:hypothetical protein GCM10007938_02200 [Vibrio zhanjiangensis]|uniref:Uncharacterized protein n=1 Tax=Vibrio zhanjiangensis TaxID=1046128 RepID=A0ABQ6EUD6_9VIBR|nr:hypothetical protein [Vibrio zhanjiangensis]GLT16444.1 hypothetical protein GCM10007938_02200 [Vibrio zhanjiangensis]
MNELNLDNVIEEVSPDLYNAIFVQKDEDIKLLAVTTINEVFYDTMSHRLSRLSSEIRNQIIDIEAIKTNLIKSETKFLSQLADINEFETSSEIELEKEQLLLLNKKMNSIKRLNVLYVLVFVLVIAILSYYIDGKLLALVSAITGGVIQNLLSERKNLMNTVD